MLKKIRRLLRWLLGGSFTMLIAACYGVPADYMGKDVKVKCDDSSGNPIPGLTVTLHNSSGVVASTSADSFGQAFLYIPKDPETYSVIIEDTDGTNNGGDFKSHAISNITYSSVLSEYDVTMTNK
ncbi:MAG: hypothetical protein HPY53_04050 [Brevinematales bacterium]|nr:hypothetical protein [Brevinematales bacterium]